MNSCFLLNLEKKLVQIHLVIFEKKNAKVPLIPKNDIIKSKAKLLQ